MHDQDRRSPSAGESGEHLAPVSYLPWVGSSDPRARSTAEDDVAAASDATGDEPEETGAERDERIDRLVVNRLRRSSLSVAEVRAVLVEHGLDDGEVEDWLERYERLGYLDDARLAEQVVHMQAVRRGRGSSAVITELTRRGIDGEVAHSAVAAIDHDAEVGNAVAVAERRARQLGGLDRAVAERRLTAFLMRRGYPSDVVREAVASALPRRPS
ncbi:regulatory protein RecX [Agromyces sp. MMS24-K17]|uniref:regulatory protein RecX n=1 Tax=Agromyces sp. MMS24-K17 TaxID=3372850 RepID=UPI0037542698